MLCNDHESMWIGNADLQKLETLIGAGMWIEAGIKSSTLYMSARPYVSAPLYRLATGFERISSHEVL